MGAVSRELPDNIRPIRKPLERGDLESFSVQMGIHNKSATDAWRTLFCVGEDEKIPSTAFNWASRADVRGRVAALRAEKANRAIERVLLSEVEVIEGCKEVFKRCMEAEPVRDKKGEETGEFKFNASGANKALEMMGKYLGLWDGKRASDGDLEEMTDEQLREAMEAGKEFFVRGEGEQSEEGSAGGGGDEAAEAAELPPLSEAG